MKNFIIIALIISNYFSIAFVGKYKKISEEALDQAARAIESGEKLVLASNKFEALFRNCVKRKSK